MKNHPQNFLKPLVLLLIALVFASLVFVFVNHGKFFVYCCHEGRSGASDSMMTSVWKTYEGKDFTIKYPGDWRAGVSYKWGDSLPVEFCPPTLVDDGPYADAPCKMTVDGFHSLAPIYISADDKLVLVNEEYRDVYAKILSTFKFTKPVVLLGASTWKTYVNTTYGFEIKYPATAELRDYTKSGLSIDISGSQPRVFLQLYAQADTSSLDEIEKQQRQYFKESATIEQVSFAGVPSLKVTSSGISKEAPYDYLIVKDGLKYVLSAGAGSDASISSQILSTFKFTK